MLTAEREDMLTELVNIGIGRAAHALSEMVDSRVGLRVPHVCVRETSMDRARDRDASIVTQAFSGGVDGVAYLRFAVSSARQLVAVLTNAPTQSAELDVEREAVITEVGNIVVNSILGAMGNLASFDLTFDLPKYSERWAPLPFTDGTEEVAVGVRFEIRDYAIDGELAVVFAVSSLDDVWEKLMEPSFA